MENPFAVLGVNKGASAADVRQAYRKLAKVHHPDKSSDPKAAEKFQRIHRAYERLLLQAEQLDAAKPGGGAASAKAPHPDSRACDACGQLTTVGKSGEGPEEGKWLCAYCWQPADGSAPDAEEEESWLQLHLQLPYKRKGKGKGKGKGKWKGKGKDKGKGAKGADWQQQGPQSEWTGKAHGKGRKAKREAMEATKVKKQQRGEAERLIEEINERREGEEERRRDAGQFAAAAPTADNRPSGKASAAAPASAGEEKRPEVSSRAEAAAPAKRPAPAGEEKRPEVSSRAEAATPAKRPAPARSPRHTLTVTADDPNVILLSSGDSGLSQRGWTRMESRSNPGKFYFFQAETGQTVVEEPTPIIEELSEIWSSSGAAGLEPTGWERRESRSVPGAFYFLHHASGQSLVAPGVPRAAPSTPPSLRLPEGWEQRESRSNPGAFYYVNTKTGQTQMDRPA